jgi:protein SCO1/2
MFAGLVCFAIVGCQRGEEAGAALPGAASSSPAVRKSEPAVTDYRLKGVVRKVERESSHVWIRHEAIPGFMDAMQMRFMIKDRGELDDVHPGDLVEGVLRVWRDAGTVSDYALSGLTVTKPAPPPQKVLEISKGGVRVAERPARLAAGESVPDFAMTGQDGKRMRLAELRGKVVVLTFIYTRCPLPDFCPLMDRKFSELAQRLSAFPKRASAVRLISLSFDPEHDTPEVLRAHARIRGAAPPLWSYAVAAHDELAKVAAPLGLLYGPTGGEIAHNLCTVIIDAEGRLARLEVGTQANRWETADFLRSIYSLIPKSLH